MLAGLQVKNPLSDHPSFRSNTLHGLSFPMGKEFTFMHCADLHLGSRFKGISSSDPELAERMRRSVMDSFVRIIDACIDRKVGALIISGDLYDDSNELPSTRMWFTRQLSRLSIPVFICRGNHDSSTTWDSTIPYPDNVHEFGQNVESIPIGEEIEVLGVSFSTPHEERNLAAMMSGDPSRFTIACLHCDIDSVSEGYSYAPCSISDLYGRSVDYWALGHIHKRNVVCTDPYVVYPGNIQGRSFKETGQKGAYLVKVSGGKVSSLDFIATQGFVWKDIGVDIAGKDMHSLMDEISSQVDGSTICRIRLTGSGELDTMLRSAGDDISNVIAAGTGCIVSGIELCTSPEIDMDSRRNGKDMGAAVIDCGLAISELPAQEIIDMICRNKVLARNRAFFETMPEEDLRSLVTDAVKGILAKMEVSR